MLGFRFPKIASRLNLGNDFARPQPRRIDVLDRIQGNFLLLIAGIENSRPIGRPTIVSLAILRRWVMDLEEELQQLSKVCFGWIKNHFNRLGVSPMISISLHS